jgi:hypothetical protein
MKKAKLTTTLNLCKQNNACRTGYDTLVAFLGPDYGMDKPINLVTILESNGIKDTIWALRATKQDSKYISRMFAADCAESVLHYYEDKYPNDNRVRKCIQAARDYAEGKISLKELRVARRAAADAAAAADAYVAAVAADAAVAANAYADAAAVAAVYTASERKKQEKLLRKYLIADKAKG